MSTEAIPATPNQWLVWSEILRHRVVTVVAPVVGWHSDVSGQWWPLVVAPGALTATQSPGGRVHHPVMVTDREQAQAFAVEWPEDGDLPSFPVPIGEDIQRAVFASGRAAQKAEMANRLRPVPS